jgi:hypothetical protein
MSDKNLLAITRIMAAVSDAIGSAQQAALQPTTDVGRAVWRAIVTRVRGLLCDSSPCDCGESGCVPCMIVNALANAQVHLEALAEGAGTQTTYHARLAVENLQAARTLARDELQRVTATAQ